MQKIYTGKQLRALYRQAEVYDHLSAEDHIERAARSFEQEFRRLYTQTGHTIYVFAGAGRCGAYALRIASYLAQRSYTVMAYLFYREGKLSEECEAIRRSIADGDLRLEEVYRNFTPPRIKEQDVIIDGLFGTELTTPLFGGYVGLVDFLNASKASIVSLELPSGLFAEDNSGNDLEHIIKAKYTISFDCPYLAFFFKENKPYIGQWSYLPLGISPQAQDELDASYYLTEDASLTSALRIPPTLGEEKILFLTTEYGHTGRTLLSAKAALYSGCHEVCALVPEEEQLALQLALPELVVLPHTPRTELLSKSNYYKALVISEGFGRGEAACSLLEGLLTSTNRPFLLDSDALELIANKRSLLDIIPKGSILIPTHAEFDRMTTKHRTDADRLSRAIELAERLDGYVILRDIHTAICLSGGTVFFDTSGNRGLHSMGCRNVLSGVIAGLLGQGYDAIVACALGVHLCGLAAELYAGRHSERSLTATQLIEQLGSAYQQLEVR